MKRNRGTFRVLNQFGTKSYMPAECALQVFCILAVVEWNFNDGLANYDSWNEIEIL